MIFGSVCSGIEAASVAWKPLGWKALFFSEIEKFPSSVLDHHYPTVPNLGDMKKFKEWPDAIIDVLVGGTPCQSFSIAGLRKGLDDPRGNLMLTYLAIAARYRPKWLVWENVPGVLSSNGGRDFGTLLGGLGQLGYGFAYRILDAQYAGVPQRRRRVFVVGHIGNWRRAAAVLFERHSLSGNPAPSRQAGKGFAHDTAPCLTSSGRGVELSGDTRGQDPVIAVASDVAPCLDASFGRLQGCSGQDANHGHGHLIAFGGNNTAGAIEVATAVNAHGGPCGRLDFESETFIAHSLRGEGFDASEDGTGRGTPLVPVAYRTAGDGAVYEEGACTAPLTTGTDQNSNVVAFDMRGREGGSQLEGPHDTASIRAASGGSSRSYISSQMQVRRLTPRECERLQGFPDDYTLIHTNAAKKIEKDYFLYLIRSYPDMGVSEAMRLAKDGPRYKALGNSMAVLCMKWLGERIAMVNEIAQ